MARPAVPLPRDGSRARWHRIAFDSVADLVTHVERATPSDWCAWPWKQNDPGQMGSASVADAARIAREGWREGRDKMAHELAAAAMMRPHVHPGRTYDVAGAFPDVPRFLAGAPDCMVDLGDTSVAARPIVRILLNVSASSMVSARHINNRGVALLSIVDAMEEAGYSVELNVADTGLSHDASFAVLLTVPVKRAGEPLELDRVAFVLGHPSFLRRFTCGAEAADPACKPLDSGLGQPCPVPPDVMGDGMIYVPHLNRRDDAQFATLETALATMRQIMVDGGIHWLAPDND